MKRIPGSVLTPAAATISALAVLTCCLPWGIGAALGALGLSVVVARFQMWFLALAIVLLVLGLVQVLRKEPRCERPNKLGIALWSIAAIVVVVIALLPQWVAAWIASLSP